MKHVIVFLCTPRCGTQWLAKNINEIYSDEAIVTHEPIENDYYLKFNIGRYDSPLLPEDNDRLNKHLEFIEEVIENKIYIEIGWQSIAGVSDFYRRFGDKLKIVHLYRHPISVAASLVTHNWYTGNVKERFEKSELDPFDEMSLLKEYKDLWIDLNLFEKSLYFWTEINLRTLETKYKYRDVDFYSLKFEDLFKKNIETSRTCLISTLSFMGLGYDNEILEKIDSPYDDYRYKTHFNINADDIFKYPQTIALANKLGYSVDSNIDLSRYRKIRDDYQKIKYKIKSIIIWMIHKFEFFSH